MTPHNDGRCSICGAPFGECEHSKPKGDLKSEALKSLQKLIDMPAEEFQAAMDAHVEGDLGKLVMDAKIYAPLEKAITNPEPTAREWMFIGIWNNVGKYWIVDGPAPGREKFSFVEKSAYEQLKQELKREQELRMMAGETSFEIGRQRDKIQAALEASEKGHKEYAQMASSLADKTNHFEREYNQARVECGKLNKRLNTEHSLLVASEQALTQARAELASVTKELMLLSNKSGEQMQVIAAAREREGKLVGAAKKLGLQCTNAGQYGPLKIAPGECKCSTCSMKLLIANFKKENR